MCDELAGAETGGKDRGFVPPAKTVGLDGVLGATGAIKTVDLPQR